MVVPMKVLFLVWLPVGARSMPGDLVVTDLSKEFRGVPFSGQPSFQHALVMG